jgi:molybdopterin-guanine dinucleotide biosynthesis protein A
MDPAIPIGDITGLVLAGGRGTRMGGVDKGLQMHRGRPLVAHALQRLQAQVGQVMVNANRHEETYARWGVPVVPDTLPDHPGPLAGFLAGLARCETPWMVTVPCDTPAFPLDLVVRLSAAVVEHGADLAIAVTRDASGEQIQPVFCLLKASLMPSIQDFTAAGQSKIGLWVSQQCSVKVPFDDASAFFNINTSDELRKAEAAHGQ